MLIWSGRRATNTFCWLPTLVVMEGPWSQKLCRPYPLLHPQCLEWAFHLKSGDFVLTLVFTRPFHDVPGIVRHCGEGTDMYKDWAPAAQSLPLIVPHTSAVIDGGPRCCESTDRGWITRSGVELSEWCEIKPGEGVLKIVRFCQMKGVRIPASFWGGGKHSYIGPETWKECVDFGEGA